MRLIGFLINSPINYTILSWGDAHDQRVAGMGSMAYWQEIARLYEKGGFDGVFFADIPAAFDHYKDRSDEAVRYGICWPNHDPMPLLGIMAAARSASTRVQTGSSETETENPSRHSLRNTTRFSGVKDITR